jgi:hypothetical protein
MSVQNQVTHLESLGNRVRDLLETLRSSNPDFEHAYETYIQQYGSDIVTVNEPINLVDTIDPVILIFGRNTSIRYSDSKRSLSGSIGALNLKVGSEYILGRREPQDSRLVVWGAKGEEEVELEAYNPEAGIIPSRVHGVFIFQDDRHVFYTDLGSSSGTVIVGESKHQGAFVRVYDPGTMDFPRIKVGHVYTTRKD